jgi:hypothetical protein
VTGSGCGAAGGETEGADFSGVAGGSADGVIAGSVVAGAVMGGGAARDSVGVTVVPLAPTYAGGPSCSCVSSEAERAIATNWTTALQVVR